MTEAGNDLVAVPERVRTGSPNPITSLDAWREAWIAAKDDPDAFWLREAKARLHWRREPSEGLRGGFHEIADGPIAFFADGELNVSESCLDQHLAPRGDKVAILWEADEPGEGRSLTYRALHQEVCRAAGALRSLGVQKGERVIIYMGMVPEAAIAMLACARLGAVHSVVFGGFSAEALRDRVRDCGAEVVITQDEGLRGGRTIPLKATCDEALLGEQGVRHVLCFQRTGAHVGWTAGRDVWWHEAMSEATPVEDAVVCAAEDPLFILYTSGSTGRPKGLCHTQAGYLTWTSWTHQTVFDLREDDVYACVADVGWITGHSYIVYGPLCNGATTLMFESTPSYPDAGRYWELCARHGVTIFYTAPTAIRALAAQGDAFVQAHDRSRLRVLGTVGEPINPEAWQWYFDVVGEGRCTIVDTWWQTETGGICITPIAPATPTRPGWATLPNPGIVPALMDEHGRPIVGPGEGRLCLSQPWPGMARTVWGDHERYVATYFATFPGYYFTGDGCRRDGAGYHLVTGRVDDVLNVAGHRIGTAEFEAVIVTVEAIAEAGVVGFPHPVKGQGVYAYVVLQPGAEPGPDLQALVNNVCRAQIGAHAKVDLLQIVPGLPKTRSGKVMRRILRKVAEGQPEALGDVSTLADPSVVEAIVAGAKSL
ncbi:MAG: acetate--CoA ligase [Deltaproteobacteria bacterium]|nr:acetate--CoA ligase [Deltaproteobacteria bacterium]